MNFTLLQYFHIPVDVEEKFKQVWIRILAMYLLALAMSCLFVCSAWFMWEGFFDNQLLMIFAIVTMAIILKTIFLPPIASGKKYTQLYKSYHKSRGVPCGGKQVERSRMPKP